MIDMKPGPKLDATCHVAMGKNLRRRAEFTSWPRRYLYDPPAFPLTPEEQDWANKQPHGEWEAFGVPEYSTTWEGMHLVIEEMQRRGYRYMIHDTHNGIPLAQFQKYNDAYELTGFGRSEGETAPHAVTVAAIKAIQGEDTHGKC